ncbi:unnamed protein product [Rhizoctonia solani]|uniref:Uncharacterized protein n=1 Tax=Rhizoctonia solani TaxID=456999 RepID=A0A8H3CXK9_9AGAM|nr:unnamed protein product [Rhizoctonia solani]
MTTQIHPAVSCILRFLDTFLLFGLGTTYVKRFASFKEIRDETKQYEWRHRQQREWDRVSTTLGLLATMMAAILALSPEPPRLAVALWLGGSVVAVSGIFVTNYLSVKSFDISDAEMPTLVEGKVFSSARLIPIAITCPPVAVRWASLLFVVGMFDYTIKYPFQRQHLAIALVPMSLSVASVCIIVGVGAKVTSDIERHRKDVIRM